VKDNGSKGIYGTAPITLNQNKTTSPLKKKNVSHILLIDGCLTFRSGLAHALQQTDDMIIVDMVATAAQVYNNNYDVPPDLSVVDVDLLDQSGIELCQWLNSHYPEMTLLLLSDRDWDVFLLAAQATQAVGLLVRNTPTKELVQQIRLATSGLIFSQMQLERIDQWEKSIGSVLSSLRPREWQTLWQIAAGVSNREISQNLEISEHTVEKYITSLFQKFELPSRAALMVFIYTSHLDVFNRLTDNARLKLLSG
jgi:DNA-binding NarL/FixJ family response regulator